MKKIIYKFLIFLTVVFFTTSSCKKNFLDVNTDPNRVTDANITPELLFVQAAVSVGDRTVGGTAADAGHTLPTQFLQNWLGYMASNGDFAPNSQEVTYNIDFSFSNGIFVRDYSTLFDLHLAEVKGLASGDTAVSGASIILSAKLFQELVDLYGDIPYTNAFKVDQTTKPSYDKAQDIYNSLLLRIDTAITYMSKTPASKFLKADIINNGDQTKWIKFANTLKLRLLIRQSEIPSFNPAPELAKIQAKGGVLGAGESITVNPGYVNDVNKQSPFYANFGYTPTGTKVSTGYNANLYIVNILQSNSDPRISRFFTSVGGKYVGDRYGDYPANVPSGAASSYFGPGLVGSATQNQWIYPSFESLFLKAEAIARGWLSGNDKQAYMDAVTESFVYLGVPDAVNQAAKYMSNSPIANYDNAGSTVASKVRFIAFQKYIANTGFDPLESYSDQRRLHFLTDNSYISVNPARLSSTLPLRLPYPQSEYTTNSENVLKEGTIDPFTTKLFWEP